MISEAHVTTLNKAFSTVLELLNVIMHAEILFMIMQTPHIQIGIPETLLQYIQNRMSPLLHNQGAHRYGLVFTRSEAGGCDEASAAASAATSATGS